MDLIYVVEIQYADGHKCLDKRSACSGYPPYSTFSRSQARKRANCDGALAKGITGTTIYGIDVSNKTNPIQFMESRLAT